MSFNPRTHTGCDPGPHHPILIQLPVSIHAPTRGATSLSISTTASTEVSIHAPTRGATLGSLTKRLICQSFNPRTHTGCDWQAKQSPWVSIKVSIHAPTRGATLSKDNDRMCNQMFQSTHPHGVRLLLSHSSKPNDMFQSTHPHGVRPCSRIPVLCIGCFNPRTHTGCDDLHLLLRLLETLFQSTHPHGVRPG